MRDSLDHLPIRQQQELERTRDILLEEFDRAIQRATKPHKRSGKVYKIILFGSYARTDWVDEPENGYQSDFDLLVVVSHPDLTDIADYWYVAEDRIARDSDIGRPINIIVHALDEVNQALTRGEYFWVDIARDGIALFDLPCHQLAIPQPLTPSDAFRMAQDYFNQWSRSADVWNEQARAASLKAADVEWAKAAAFNMHQTAERLYICYLLVRTLYFPRSHNIKFLRSLAEDQDPRLVAAWPRTTRQDRARFERLKRAYVEARYSASYTISDEDLQWLGERVEALRQIVDEVCRKHLDALRTAAEAS